MFLFSKTPLFDFFVVIIISPVIRVIKLSIYCFYFLLNHQEEKETLVDTAKALSDGEKVLELGNDVKAPIPTGVPESKKEVFNYCIPILFFCLCCIVQ